MSFKLFVLAIIIIIVALFAYFRFSANGDPTSYFNQHTRYGLGKYKALRWLLGLHNDGDARAEYLYGQGPIVIEVVKSEGVELDEDALRMFAAKVTEYTGRTTSVVQQEEIPGGTVSDTDLDVFVAQHRKQVALGTTNLFVMYVGALEDGGAEIGKTYREYGIVLSDSALKKAVESYPNSLPDYQESTLLHEFGHQVGLGHNEDKNCVMATRVEKPERLERFFSDITPTGFCPMELDQLEQIKMGLQ